MTLKMPVLVGYAATKRIRTLPGGEVVKIIALTASVLAEQREKFLESGCDDMLRKPFRSHEIFEAMARQLDLQYRYKGGGAASLQQPGREVRSEMLAELPPELVQELRETTPTLNRKAILDVIDRIETYAPETAAGLRDLVQNFQTERLRELLRESQ